MRQPIPIERVRAVVQWRGGIRRVLGVQQPMEGYGRLAAQTTGRLNAASTPTCEPIRTRLRRRGRATYEPIENHSAALGDHVVHSASCKARLGFKETERVLCETKVLKQEENVL